MGKDKLEKNTYNGIERHDILFLLTYFFIFEIIGLFAFVLVYMFIPLSDSYVDLLYELSFYAVLTGMGISYYKDDLIECFNKFKKHWFKIILILLGITIIDTYLEYFMDIIFKLPIPENQEGLNEAFMEFPIFESITTVIFAPFIEELVFRHILIGKLSGRISTISAAIISIVLFAFVHSGFSISFLSYITGSIILALIYIKSGKNVVVSIIYHMIWNLLATITMISLM
ncbi:CPBP family intramembrane glutamic endopeptidase [Miniphocaeibacter halophilus]|uniref:CPBP family intramembrane metalloprotease n=1 Tax=Miniphocaeibacter halophilus TaxID=2931922 RepID=A0AC61N2E5_9FIRM|nr:type II CAAX endopeptidase family protein [Miniphocaeibacter halophilus]QQK08801.1 CPBP family intramembrane metalloprotease [Miniphocaeibacter halophilus]